MAKDQDGFDIIHQPGHCAMPWEKGTPIGDAKDQNRYCYVCNGTQEPAPVYIRSEKWDEPINSMIGPKSTVYIKHHEVQYKYVKCPCCGYEWDIGKKVIK